VRIWKQKLCRKTLKTFQVQDKTHLNNIFKSYLSYRDLQSLRNSHDYFEKLQKNLFVMIKQLGPPTSFVTFVYAERLWDLLIKTLHTLHALKLNFPNKI